MAGGKYGADVAQLRALGDRLDRAADELERSGRVLSQGISPTMAWRGPDAGAFQGEWSGSHYPRLSSAVAALRSAARTVRRNADEQERTSAADPGAAGGAGSSPSRTPVGRRRFESRTGFDVDRSVGLGLRFGRSNGFEAIHGSDMTEYRYTAKDYLSLSTGDAFKVLGFVAAVTGKGSSPFSFDLGIAADRGTQFIWQQEPGGTADEVKGLNGIPVRQVAGANFVTGYSSAEVLRDVAAGQLAQPDAVAHVSGVRAFAAGEVEAGTSVFGQSGEVSAERVTEHWKDGRTVDTYAMTGTLGAHGGVHLEPGGVGLGVSLQAVADTEARVQVSTTYGVDGRPESLEYVVVGHAEAGGEFSGQVAGGGAYERETQGVLVERTLTFDLRDPEVARVVANGGTTDLVAHADWASEQVKVFRTTTSSSGADAILFEVGAESSNLELVESASRPPATNPLARLIDGHNGMHSQVITNEDGTSSVVWLGEY